MIVKDFIELVKTSPDESGMPRTRSRPGQSRYSMSSCVAAFEGERHNSHQSYRLRKFELTFKTRCEGLDPLYLQTLYRLCG